MKAQPSLHHLLAKTNTASTAYVESFAKWLRGILKNTKIHVTVLQQPNMQWPFVLKRGRLIRPQTRWAQCKVTAVLLLLPWAQWIYHTFDPPPNQDQLGRQKSFSYRSITLGWINRIWSFSENWWKQIQSNKCSQGWPTLPFDAAFHTHSATVEIIIS